MSDVYNQPEDFSLEVVAEIDYDDGGYEFDKRVVWRHTDGKLYTGRNAGCSCPSPFEDYTKLEDLDELVDMVALREEVRSEALDQQDGQTFLDRVAGALRRSKGKNR